MSVELFLYGSPLLAKVYRQAYINKLDASNSDLWWAGAYIKQAVLSAISETMPWFKSKSIPYPDKPYRVTPLTAEEKKQEAEKERQKAIKNLDILLEAWNRKHE